MTATPTPEHLEATGDCYREAFKALTRFILSGQEGWAVVHGRPTLQVEPFCQYGHAWLELGDIVYAASTGSIFPKSLYYAAGKIDPANNHVYDKDQVRRMILDFRHYGPWEGPDAHPPIPETTWEDLNADAP